MSGTEGRTLRIGQIGQIKKDGVDIAPMGEGQTFELGIRNDEEWWRTLTATEMTVSDV